MTVERLRRNLEIAGRPVGDDAPVFIVAEIACGHQGDVEQARQLVDAAAAAGADAVQFQIFDPADNMTPDSDLYQLLEKLYLTPAQWRDLVGHARQRGIAVSIFVYDNVSLELALELGPDMLKLNSGELSNPDMIVEAAKSGLPFTLGTGASTMQEIAEAIALSLRHGGDKMVLMHGVQSFPTPSEQAHIRRLRILRDSFACPVGYADHTEGASPLSSVIDLVAVGMGAAVLEKHVVVDRGACEVDYQAALEPGEFARYVETMRAGSQALGPDSVQPLSESDHAYRRFQKKNIVAAKPLAEGERLGRASVRFLRLADAEAVPPSRFAEMDGKRLLRPIDAFAPIDFADLED